ISVWMFKDRSNDTSALSVNANSIKITDVTQDGDTLTFAITSQKLSSDKGICVFRTFEDFDWLQQSLFSQEDDAGLHGVIFPPLPARPLPSSSHTQAKALKLLGFLALGDNWQLYCKALEFYLQQVAAHNILGKNKLLHSFLSSTESPGKQCSKKGIFDRLSHAVEEMRKEGHRDVDEFFHNERESSTHMTALFKATTEKFLDTVLTKQRLSLACGHFSTSLRLCVTQDNPSAAASKICLKLSDIMDAVKNNLDKVSENDMCTLGLGLDFESRYQEAKRDRDGRVLTSEESVQRRWKEYFEELMNEENEREKRVEGVNSVEQKVDKIRKDEVRKALKRMKSGKAVGPDDIPVEVWKCLGEAAVEFLTSLFNRVLENLEKAYDRVPREELWYCMRKSGVAEKYVRVVQDMYERSRTVVRCAVGQTEEFKVEVGLHQGSALSPFLFAIVMDQLSEEVRQESPWTMMFADDIVICSESREQVEENLERRRFALEKRGMKVSRSKTEYMCVNEREGSGTVRLQGEEVKKVQEFKYLGSTVQSNGECGKEVKKRVQEMLFRRICKLVELEAIIKNAEKAKPNRKAVLDKIQTITQKEFNLISSVAKEEIDWYHKTRVTVLRDFLSLWCEKQLHTARESAALFSQHLEAFRQSPV
ncbi:hypothetical protein QTP86_031143, partial [Hemibagrus guttatus]